MELQNRSKRSQLRTLWIGAATVALVATFFFQGAVRAQVTFASSASSRGDIADVTYARDVAPIIQQNCTICHQQGGIGPMELVDYDDVRRYARRIKAYVADRVMPPYYYDNDIGIQELKHDWRLSDEDINTIVAWVDQGTPLGDPDNLPVQTEVLDANDWSLMLDFGQPDLVVPSTPIDVPASGLDMWHRPFVPVGNTEERCIKALQVKPQGSAKAVVHHANSTFRLLQDIHMFPGGLGKAAPNAVLPDNIVELGIWLHPEDYEYEYSQNLTLYGLREGELLMAPHGTTMTQGFHSFDHPVRIDSFQPHGHLRLRSASLEIFYPKTRRTEVISMISNWSATWHQSHLYEDDVAPLVPAGAVMVLKQWYDNTDGNPHNPDPDQWVSGGSRTADEMSHAWIAVTHLDEEGYQRLIEERKNKKEGRIISDSN